MVLVLLTACGFSGVESGVALSFGIGLKAGIVLMLASFFWNNYSYKILFQIKLIHETELHG